MLADYFSNEFKGQLEFILEKTLGTVIAVIANNGTVVDCNQAFMDMVEAVDSTALETIHSYLDDASSEQLFGNASARVDLRLVFTIKSQPGLLLKCSIHRSATHILLVGNRPYLFESDTMNTLTQLNMELGTMTRELQRKNRELEKARDEIKTLSGLIPICANCKSIRSDDGFWQKLECYLSEHSDAMFSHGICEDCIKELYPEYADDVLKKNKNKSG